MPIRTSAFAKGLVLVFCSFTLIDLVSPWARADLAIETETARVVPPGHFELGAAFEFQTSSAGEEYALPMAFETGLIDRLEILVEPVPFTAIRGGGSSASGLGDTEVTLTYLLVREATYLPALAIAGEVKIPTARSSQIGSKEFDYRLYGVLSKRVGDFDLHFNLGYNIIGAPSGSRTRNPIDAAFAVEWFVHPKFDLFAEVTYVGSSIRGGGSSSAENPGGEGVTPAADLGDIGRGVGAEIAGEEIVGSAGIRYHLTPVIDLFASFSYDNKDDQLYRTGITFKF